MPVRYPAAAVLALESAGVVVLALWQVLALFSGDTTSVVSALALLVGTLVAAALVAGFSIATARGRSFGRSGGIVVQVLILAVALGTLTGPGANAGIAAALAAPAVIGGILLVLAVRAAAEDDPRR
jgi:hypothetical protein